MFLIKSAFVCKKALYLSKCAVKQQLKLKKRHDRFCAQLHFNICKEVGVILENKHWYDDVPKWVETSHEGKVNIMK